MQTLNRLQKKTAPEAAPRADVIRRALLQLIEEPVSIEPLILLLGEIDALTEATASALFIKPGAFSGLTLLASTDMDDPDWPQAPAKILPRALALADADGPVAVSAKEAQAEYNYLCVRLRQKTWETALLVLKLAPALELSERVTAALLEHAGLLAEIIASVQRARLKRRQTQYEERAVIARELHDSLAQSLSYLKIQTSRLQARLADNEPNMGEGIGAGAGGKAMEVDAIMEDLRSNLNLAYRQLRELISVFRLTIGGKNFSQALQDSVEEFSRRSGIAFDLDNRLPPEALSVMEETQLLHIIREALANVVRHSRAKACLISIRHDDTARITVSIEDDGIGLPAVPDPDRHFGIIIMQERAHSIGGSIRLGQREAGGARLQITFQAGQYSGKSAGSRV